MKRNIARTSLMMISIAALYMSLMPATVNKKGISATTAKPEARAVRRGIPDQGRRPLPASGSLASQTRLLESYGQLPLSFEANRGQTDSQVKFVSRGRGYTLFLTSNEAVLRLKKPDSADSFSKSAALRPRSPGLVPRVFPLSFRRQAAQPNGNSALPGFPQPFASPATRFEPSLSRGRQSGTPTDNGPRVADAVLHMKLVGANPSPRVRPRVQLPGRSNYFIGNDPKKWRTNVPNYAQVKYHDVYPGVDLVYYGNQGQLEYDFVVAPGADPKAITLDLAAGSSRQTRDGGVKPPLQIGAQGDLLVGKPGAEVVLHKPVVYQMRSTVEGRRSKVEQHSAPAGAKNKELRTKHLLDGRYVLKGNQVTFEVAFYDPTKPLVIDPVLRYSTFLGGSGDELITPSGTQGLAIDPEGNAYVIGATDSIDFPVTPGAFQTELKGGSGAFGCFDGVAGDAFITKLNAKGDAIVYSTYLGGSDDDCGEGIAVDPAGNAYVAGETLSTDFPITKGAFQSACASCSNGLVDTFAAKLSHDGSRLIYSTYIGGDDADLFPMLALDRFGNLYIQGSTFSADYPTTKGAFQTACLACPSGGADTYVTKLNREGTALVYSTYLGGSVFDICGAQIAVDAGGDAYVNGFTCSPDFPTRNPLQAAPAGGCDGFLTKLNPAGSAPVYSTYLGGSYFDTITGTAVDSAGNAYVSGSTLSSDFPVTPGAFQTNFVGGSHCPFPPCADAFVAKINPSGSALVYSTYLGGTGDETFGEVVVDSDGNAYVNASTTSTDFPTLNPFQPTNAGGYDIFVTELNAAGDGLVYSTYLGGSSDDFPNGLAIDSRRNIYLAGITASSDFLAVNPVQPQFGGGTFDSLLAKISPDNAPGLGLSRLTVDFAPEPAGTTSPPQTVTVHSVGSQSLIVSQIGAAPPEFAQTNTCTRALAPGEACTISITYTAKKNGADQGVLTVVANSSPASKRVRLLVTDQAGSAPAQRAAPTRPGNANASGRLLDWRNAILKKSAAH